MKVYEVVKKVPFPKGRSDLGLADQLIRPDRAANIDVHKCLSALADRVEVRLQSSDDLLWQSIGGVVSED